MPDTISHPPAIVGIRDERSPALGYLFSLPNSFLIRAAVFLCLGLSATTFVSIQAATPPSFATAGAVQVYDAVVNAADFNKDGLTDLLSVSSSVGSKDNVQVSVLLNDGHGGFAQGPTAAFTGQTPFAITSADFDGDGKLDIAVFADASVYVFLQRAHSLEKASITRISGTYYVDILNIVAGDLNGDGRTDLVVPTSAGAMLLFGNGDGSLQAPILASSDYTTYVALADVNGDKKLDIIQDGASPYDVLVLLGDGAGNFHPSPSQPAFPSLFPQFAVADFNQDGRADIAAMALNSIYLALGNGDGSFQTPVAIALPTGFSGGQVTSGDLSGDGIPDLIALAIQDGYSDSPTLLTYMNSGSGFFQTPATYQLPPTSYVAVANLNGDEYGDIVVYNQADPVYGLGAGLLINDGKGALQDGKLIPGPGFEATVAVDLNEDGRPDLIQLGDAAIKVYLNTGNNASLFTEQRTPTLNADSLIVGDFNNDGHVDAVLGDGYRGELLLGSGDGSFTAQAGALSLAGLGSLSAAVDMNGDGNLDIVTTAPAVLLGNGDGTFQAPILGSPCQNFGGAAVADFSGHGNPDLLLICESQLMLYPGAGDGTLFPPITLGVSSSIQSVVTGDFNRDGMPDIAYSAGNADTDVGEVGILLNHGGFIFDAGQSVPALIGTLITGQFDGNTNVDLALANRTFFSVFPGNGDGTFSMPALFEIGSGGSYPLAGSFASPTRKNYEDLVFETLQGLGVSLNNRRTNSGK